MFAALLQRGRDTQHLILVEVGQKLDVGHGRTPLGERAGLVEHDVGQAVRMLQRRDVPDQNARPGGGARAGHDRRRCREAQGARAGDHQGRRGGDNGRLQTRIGHQPGAQEGGGRKADHRRHEYPTHLVHKALHGRLADLGVLHQTDHPGQGGVLADGRGPDIDVAVDGDGARGHRVAHSLGNGAALAGYKRLVHLRLAAHDLAVGGDPVPRPAHDDVAGHEVPGRALGHASVRRPHQGRVGLQVQQFPDGRGRAALGARLQMLADHHQRDDERRGLEVQMRLVPEGDHLMDAEGECRGGAQGHQHIHIGASAAQRVRGALVEPRPEAELQRHGQNQFDPGGHAQVRGTAAQEHEGHLNQKRRRKDGGGEDRTPFAEGLQLLPFGPAGTIGLRH